MTAASNMSGNAVLSGEERTESSMNSPLFLDRSWVGWAPIMAVVCGNSGFFEAAVSPPKLLYFNGIIPLPPTLIACASARWIVYCVYSQ